MTKPIDSTSSRNFNSNSNVNRINQQNTKSSQSNGITDTVFKQLPANGGKPLEIVSCESENQTLHQDTKNSTSIFKKIFSRVAGGFLGVARALLNLSWSWATAGKYLVVAIIQACRGEGLRALAAFGLAFTAPVWVMVDGFDKTYTRFAAWGDGIRGLTENNESGRSKVERAKAYAKKDVITAEGQDVMNAWPVIVGGVVVRVMTPT